MTERVDPQCEAARVEQDAARRAEARRIATELAALARSGQILPGSIQERHTRCGQANCACHGDPPKRYGPYFQWTRKVANKTVGKWLSVDQRDDYQAWVDNDRRAHELLAQLEALGVSALEADSRSRRRR
jgi:hypothetical protein